jgi:hypothetical protein
MLFSLNFEWKLILLSASKGHNSYKMCKNIYNFRIKVGNGQMGYCIYMQYYQLQWWLSWDTSPIRDHPLLWDQFNMSQAFTERPLQWDTSLFWETTLKCHKPSLGDLSNEIPPSLWETTLTCHNPSLRDLSNEISPSFGRPL